VPKRRKTPSSLQKEKIMKGASLKTCFGISLGTFLSFATVAYGQQAVCVRKESPPPAAAGISPQALQANREIIRGGASSRIVGGEPVLATDHAWQVALVRGILPEPQRSQFCGGSLIGTNWVLTAAHCVRNSVVREDPSRLDVVAGTAVYISGGERLKVAAIHTHPKYNASTMENDFALLQLASPATTGGSATTRPIAFADKDTQVPAGTTACVTGWGATAESAAGSLELLGAEVPVVSNDVCNQPQSYNGDIKSTMLCAGKEVGGVDSCQGDSGGPLWATIQGRQTLVGVVSWGEGCARRLKYGIYALVPTAAEWIASTTAARTGGAR
jgi:transmembrane serine protease 11D